MNKEDLAVVKAYDKMTFNVYYDYTGAGRGPEAIAGPFDTEEEANAWVVECDYTNDSNVFIDNADLLDPEEDYDDSMDGDHDSAMASAGWGTDEDYGGTDERF